MYPISYCIIDIHYIEFLQTCNDSKVGKVEKLFFTSFWIILGDWTTESVASASVRRVQKKLEKQVVTICFENLQ